MFQQFDRECVAEDVGMAFDVGELKYPTEGPLSVCDGGLWVTVACPEKVFRAWALQTLQRFDYGGRQWAVHRRSSLRLIEEKLAFDQALTLASHSVANAKAGVPQ